MSKYNAKKVEYKGIVFDSKVECEYYQYLESNMNGTNYDRIEIQPKFELQPKFGKQKTDYVYSRFLFVEGRKLVEVIDVKGKATEVANIKAKIFRYQYRDVNLTWICKAPKYTGQEWMVYEDLVKVRRKRKRNEVI